MISASGLTKRYGDFTAVDGIDFEVARGESFGILGPNGAGKSTTMRMIAATLLRTAGDLTILGKDPSKEGPATARTSVWSRSRTTMMPSSPSWKTSTYTAGISACPAPT